MLKNFSKTALPTVVNNVPCLTCHTSYCLIVLKVYCGFAPDATSCSWFYKNIHQSLPHDHAWQPPNISNLLPLNPPPPAPPPIQPLPSFHHRLRPPPPSVFRLVFLLSVSAKSSRFNASESDSWLHIATFFTSESRSGERERPTPRAHTAEPTPSPSRFVSLASGFVS